MAARTRDALLDTLTGLADRRSTSELEALVDALATFEQPDRLAESSWGTAPPDPAETRLASLKRLREHRARALDGAVTREEAAGVLGISAQQVSNLLEAGELVGIRDGGRWRLPRWQFSADGALPGLRELAQVYPGGAVALTLWATTPTVDLADRSPAQALAEGDTGATLRMAGALRAAGW